MNPQTFARAVPLPFMLATVLATPGTAPLPVAAQSASSIVVPNAWNDRDLLDAIRRGDTSALKSALASKVDPNTKDETGATALMYAAAYASAADVQLLLEAGADVNAANGFGSTALMWAAGDPAKVRLLLDRGAAPNARAVDRTTALLVAARLESGESMQLLIERGANPTLTASDTVNLLQVAYTAESPDVRRVLSESGVALKDPHEIRYSLLPNLFDPPLLRRLLDAGADPNQQVARSLFTTLALAASSGEVETVRLLLARGADARAGGSRGWTPLMMAAASARPNPAVTALLLENGADLHARDDAGRTALDWALMQGETPVARQLREAGAKALAPPRSAPPAVATPRSARVAIEKALTELQPASPGFTRGTKCISCHNQSLPAIAVKLATDRGVPVDRALAAHPTEATLAFLKSSRETYLLGNADPGFVGGMPYALLALAEEGVAPNPATDAVALCLANAQRRDGSWNVPVGHAGGGIRPPLGSIGSISLTALAIRGLSVYAPPGRQAETAARLARALEFLRRAAPVETQDESFKLLGLVWSSAPASELDAQAKRILALQRADGGGHSCRRWRQTRTRRDRRCMRSRPAASRRSRTRIAGAPPTCCAPNSRMARGWCARGDSGSSHILKPVSRTAGISSSRRRPPPGPPSRSRSRCHEDEGQRTGGHR
jgi:ankyrin repeat protein